MKTRGSRRKKFRFPVARVFAWLLLIVVSACSGTAEAVPTTVTFQETALPLMPTSSAAPVGGVTAVSTRLVTPLVSSTATTFRLPTATATRTPVPPIVQPSATPDCENNLRYIEDLTVPDGAIVPAGTVFDKRWQVENNGSCNWSERYRLKRLSGPALGLGDEQALYPARAGAPAVIRMLLTAPAEPGAYRSAWQAVDSLGQLFGDPIFVDIIVN